MNCSKYYNNIKQFSAIKTKVVETETKYKIQKKKYNSDIKTAVRQR